jgi:hypothetical protein
MHYSLGPPGWKQENWHRPVKLAAAGNTERTWRNAGGMQELTVRCRAMLSEQLNVPDVDRINAIRTVPTLEAEMKRAVRPPSIVHRVRYSD